MSGQNPQDVRARWKWTSVGWAKADDSYTGKQGGNVERVGALERETSRNPGSMY